MSDGARAGLRPPNPDFPGVEAAVAAIREQVEERLADRDAQIVGLFAERQELRRLMTDAQGPSGSPATRPPGCALSWTLAGPGAYAAGCAGRWSASDEGAPPGMDRRRGLGVCPPRRRFGR